eukprot:TRINITY_DN16317_c0_g1_i1.p1 TRINITY_DN16317_c0_g1~~TRINITY_DN16317_c0_g1_i1.p1  ORF type:complete len:650 (+),score=172.81 TRINITY_DN16317_c0_g1_i1:152-2101(+)
MDPPPLTKADMVGLRDFTGPLVVKPLARGLGSTASSSSYDARAVTPTRSIGGRSPLLDRAASAGPRQFATLEDRYQASELALDKSERRVEVLNSLLTTAKESIENLGEEADAECSNLHSELEAKQAELDAALAKLATYSVSNGHCGGDASGRVLNGVDVSCSPPSGPDSSTRPAPTRQISDSGLAALQAEVLALSQEALVLRESEEASWERHAETHREMAGEVAGLRESAERSQRQCAFIEHAERERFAAACSAEAHARNEEHDLMQRCALLEEALSKEQEAASSVELMKFEAEDAKTKSLAITEELVILRQVCEENELFAAEQQSENKQSLWAVEDAEATAQGRLKELEEAEKALTTTEESLQDVQARLANANCSSAREVLSEASQCNEALLQATAERADARSAEVTELAACSELRQRLNEEEATCRHLVDKLSEASRKTHDENVTLADARWVRLVLVAEAGEVKARSRLTRIAWALGGRKTRARANQLTAESAELAEQLRLHTMAPSVAQELEAHCEQGERRLAVLERIHAEQMEASMTSVRSAAGLFKEAQAGWRRELTTLRHEVRAEEALATAEELRCARAEAEAEAAKAETSSALPTPQPTTDTSDLEARLKEECAQVMKLREDLAGAEEAIGILVANSDHRES